MMKDERIGGKEKKINVFQPSAGVEGHITHTYIIHYYSVRYGFKRHDAIVRLDRV